MANPIIKTYEEKMVKRLGGLDQDLAGIRAGRANPAVLDKLHVDYYGVPSPINQVASVQVPEARMMIIQPWDATLLKEIERTIQKSDLGINPSNDGKCLRLSFPPLTEDRRKDITKTVKRYGEEAKVAVRNIRRDALDSFRVQKKNGKITEDDLKDLDHDIQVLTDKKCELIEKIVDAKEKEILEL